MLCCVKAALSRRIVFSSSQCCEVMIAHTSLTVSHFGLKITYVLTYAHNPEIADTVRSGVGVGYLPWKELQATQEARGARRARPSAVSAVCTLGARGAHIRVRVIVALFHYVQ